MIKFAGDALYVVWQIQLDNMDANHYPANKDSKGRKTSRSMSMMPTFICGHFRQNASDAAKKAISYDWKNVMCAGIIPFS